MVIGFDKTVRKNLLAIVAAYRRATGASLSEVSREFYGRGDFFAKYKIGKRTPSTKSVEAMLEKFRAKWPPKADWPFTRAILMGRTAQE